MVLVIPALSVVHKESWLFMVIVLFQQLATRMLLNVLVTVTAFAMHALDKLIPPEGCSTDTSIPGGGDVAVKLLEQ